MGNLKEGKNLDDLRLEEKSEFDGFNLPNTWFLENFFSKLKLKFWHGIILVYFLFIIAHVGFIVTNALGWPFLELAREITYITLDFLFVPLPLVIMGACYKSLKKMKDVLEKYIREKKIKSPIYVEKITKKEIQSIDQKFVDTYVNPVSAVTIQKGLDIAFNKYYVFGFGLLVGIIAISIAMNLGWAVDAESQETYGPYHSAYTIVKWLVEWTVVGMLTWIIFSCLFIATYAGNFVIEFRPQKSISFYYKQIYDVGKKFWTVGSYFVTIQVPVLIALNFTYRDIMSDIQQLHGFVFVVSILSVAIPIIISGSIYFYKNLGDGMHNSKTRMESLMETDLELLKEKCYSEGGEKYAAPYTILLTEYKDLQQNSENEPRRSYITTAATIAGPPASGLSYFSGIVELDFAKLLFEKSSETLVDFTANYASLFFWISKLPL